MTGDLYASTSLRNGFAAYGFPRPAFDQQIRGDMIFLGYLLQSITRSQTASIELARIQIRQQNATLTAV